jgi:hypothetical protein
MKVKIAICTLIAAVATLPAVHAQEHGEVGVFGDLFRVNSTNLTGVGGRVAINVTPAVGLEFEGAYDFEQTATSTFNNGGTIANIRSGLRAAHAFAGPRFNLGPNGPARPFLFIRGGVDKLFYDAGPATVGSIPTDVQGYNKAIFPGGGVEFWLGPVGVRLEAGDEIYWQNGAHSNLRVQFGPHIRF